jgi:asparagine synthase (glutamine-hydrolysing)
VIKKFEIGMYLQKNRGPDGYWIFCDGFLIFGQSLLSIADPNNGIHPYMSTDKAVIACANGEIYNAGELRTELKKQGAVFSSESDCEVIAHGYRFWNEDIFSKIDGMFAISLFDRTSGTLLLYRDTVGIRPLYYTVGEECILFASEPRILISAGLCPGEISEEGLFHSLTVRYPIEPLTMYKDIRAVMPGELIAYNETRTHRRIFTPFPEQADDENTSPAFSPDFLKKTVEQAVEKRIPAKCRYGTFLSGGLDSSIVSVLADASDPNRIPSFVCGFSGPHIIDERKYAKRVADRFGLPLVSDSLSFEDFLITWPLVLLANSGPVMFNSSIPLFLLCKQARERGAKVMLSGEGADEMFIGYERYPEYVRHNRMTGDPEYVLAYDKEINDYGYVSENWIADPQWGERQFRRLLDRISDYPFYKKPYSGLTKKAEFDRRNFLIALLMRQDRVGLTNTIEIRVPFLDTRVIREAARYAVTEHLSASGMGKIMLRKAFAKVLGYDIADIPKIGFPLPLSEWYQHPAWDPLIQKLGTVLKDIPFINEDALIRWTKLPQDVKTKKWRDIWTLMNVAMWWKANASPDALLTLWEDVIPEHSDELREKAECYGLCENPGVPELFPFHKKYPFFVISKDWTAGWKAGRTERVFSHHMN